MLECCALPVAVPVKGVTEEVPADPVINACRQHPVLERMTQRIEGVPGVSLRPFSSKYLFTTPLNRALFSR